MEKQLRVLMIGAHLDDNDFCGGGTALKYLQLGHKVRFLSVCNGSGGHHVMSPAETAACRYKEAQAVAALTGLEYDVWDNEDCEVVASLENRKKIVRYIREFNPDIIFTHRTNDYHADHRNTALLVQDASYLVIVPHFCDDVPAMEKMPVIMYFRDKFKYPPFTPDVVVDIDDVMDKKYEMFNCHVSQVYEWLPYTHGDLAEVPTDPKERLEWLKSPRVPRDRVLTIKELSDKTFGKHCEYKEAIYAAKYRKDLIKRYGKKGKKIIFAEAFECSEYGTPLDDKNIKTLFPF